MVRIGKAGPKIHAQQQKAPAKKPVGKDLSQIVQKVSKAASGPLPRLSVQTEPPKSAKHAVKLTRKVFNEKKSQLANIKKAR